MNLVVITSMALSFAAVDPSSETAERARQLEQSAFAAVSAHRYCEAMALFVAANASSPAPDLVYNAARAADLAGDRARAASLYGDVIATRATADARRVEAGNRIATLHAAIAQSGTGPECSATAIPATTAPTTPDAPIIAPGSTMTPAPTVLHRSNESITRHASLVRSSRASDAVSTAGAGTGMSATRANLTRDAHVVGDVSATTSRETPMQTWGLVSTGAGAATAVVGAVCVSIGGEPWVTAAVSPEGSSKSGAEVRWQEYGQGTVAGGAVLLAASAALITSAVLIGNDDVARLIDAP